MSRRSLLTGIIDVMFPNRSARRQSRLKRIESEWRADIAAHGWIVVHVPSDDDDAPVAFHYTVGLTEHDLPEVITFGLPPETGGQILNDLADRLLAGLDHSPGTTLNNLVDDYHVDLWPAYEAPIGFAIRMYGSRASCIQLVTPDERDRMPWEAGYADPSDQPLLFEPPQLNAGG